MSKMKQLLSKLKKDIHHVSPEKPQGSKGWISKKESDKIIRFALGISGHYAKCLGIPHEDALEILENNRSYWSINYYQKANHPRLDRIEKFETLDEFKLKFPSGEFRCPLCKGLSTHPTICNTKNKANTKSGICDWKAYGLFGCLEKEYKFIILDEFKKNNKISIYKIFPPIELENIIN